MRYKHPLIIYELDGVLADCSEREADVEAAGPHYRKGSSAYWKMLFAPYRLRQDLLVDGGRNLTYQLWKANIHQIILTRRPISLTQKYPFQEIYGATMAWCFEQNLMPGWFRAWIFCKQRVRSEARWKQEQVYLYMGEHSEVDHLYMVDTNEENRYAIGFLCHDFHLDVDLLPDIHALKAILERDGQI